MIQLRHTTSKSKRESLNDNQLKVMIISFDIDNTLIPYGDEFEVEERKLILKIIGVEPIRKGTIDLFKKLESRGHTIWIYTTSYRSSFNLKKTFISYGLHPSRYINEPINRKKLRGNNCTASKNPKLFGIDIHVDDSEGVQIEGEKFGFKTILIDTSDKYWTNKIQRVVYELENRLVN